MQQNEDYVLKVLQEVGLVSRKQVDAARTRLDSQNNVVDVLIKDGIVSESDVSRSLAAHAHMDWIDLATIRPSIFGALWKRRQHRFAEPSSVDQKLVEAVHRTAMAIEVNRRYLRSTITADWC